MHKRKRMPSARRFINLKSINSHTKSVNTVELRNTTVIWNYSLSFAAQSVVTARIRRNKSVSTLTLLERSVCDRLEYIKEL